MPCRSRYAWMSAGGQAEPPTTTSFIEDVVVLLASRYASKSVQIVGTAAANVGRSASIIAASGAACRNRSGISSEAPDMNAAYGMPQAIAWNIGTTTSALVASLSAKDSGMQTCKECSQID